jgi:two-component sensor histidine kinase
MLSQAEVAEQLQRSGLRGVEATRPILADLLRCDAVMYAPTEAGALAVAEVRPMTVPSIYAERQVCRVVTRSEEPAVIRVLASGRPARRLSRVLVHGAPTVQDVFPIIRAGVCAAAVVFEVGLIELERQRRKSPILRRALEQLRQAVLAGRVVGAHGLARLGEHDGPLIVDAYGQVTYISSVAEQLYRKLGYTRSLMRRNVTNLQTDESIFYEALESGACVEKTVQEGPYVWTRWAFPIPADPRPAWFRRVGSRPGNIEAVLLVVRDVTAERLKEQELRIKSAMIQEIHHRVKNNLQTIASLLRIQARRTESPEVGEILRETINRILSIAVVHESLSHDESSIIDVREVTQRIITEVTQGILDPEKRIRFTIRGDDFPLPAQQATSCALIVNELLQNAVKHAFRGRTEGEVVVDLSSAAEQMRIEIVDDGRGVEPGFDYRREGSLGLQIVRTLVRDDLKGEFEIREGPSGGVRATIAFPRAGRSTRTVTGVGA